MILDPDLTREEFNNALTYLDDCGIFVPHFPHRIVRSLGDSEAVSYSDGRAYLRLGCYLTRGLTRWFVMHELCHVLVHFYRPQRDHRYARLFGGPQPADYDDIHPIQRGLTSLGRPNGFPSVYAKIGGGEEHFVELAAFLYCEPRQFASKPPADLAASWSVAWHHGLSLMTRDHLPRRRPRAG